MSYSPRPLFRLPQPLMTLLGIGLFAVFFAFSSGQTRACDGVDCVCSSAPVAT